MRLTLVQAAEEYGVTTMAIRYWIKDGNIKTGREKVIGVKPRIVVEKEDIDNYLKSKNK